MVPGICQAGVKTSIKVVAVFTNLKFSDQENMLRKKVDKSASRGNIGVTDGFYCCFIEKPGELLSWVS